MPSPTRWPASPGPASAASPPDPPGSARGHATTGSNPSAVGLAGERVAGGMLYTILVIIAAIVLAVIILNVIRSGGRAV